MWTNDWVDRSEAKTNSSNRFSGRFGILNVINQHTRIHVLIYYYYYYCCCRWTTCKHTCKIVLYIFHIFNGLSNHLFRIQNINIYLLAHFQCYPIARATTDNYSTKLLSRHAHEKSADFVCFFSLFLSVSVECNNFPQRNIFQNLELQIEHMECSLRMIGWCHYSLQYGI